MQFIAMLAVLGLLYCWEAYPLLHNDSWFKQWRGFCFSRLEQPLLAFAVSIFVPVAGLALVLLFLGHGHYIWGLPEFLLCVLVLAYCLGRGDFDTILRDYNAAWARGDVDQLPEIIQRLDADYSAEGASVNQIHAAGCERLLYVSFTRMFAVLFWFALGGPALALFYLLLNLSLQYERAHLAQSGSDSSFDLVNLLTKLRDIMEWPAARLFSLTFLLAGDFSRALNSWLLTVMDAKLTNSQVIYRNALAALHLDSMDVPAGATAVSPTLTDLVSVAAAETHAMQQLVSRCLMFAIAGVALFELMM